MIEPTTVEITNGERVRNLYSAIQHLGRPRPGQEVQLVRSITYPAYGQIVAIDGATAYIEYQGTAPSALDRAQITIFADTVMHRDYAILQLKQRLAIETGPGRSI